MSLIGRDWPDGRPVRLVRELPVIACHEHALFVPPDGVFDRNGRCVVPATDFARDGSPVGGLWRVDPDRHADAASPARDGPHVAAGPLPDTMGGFLTRTFPRFWSAATAHPPEEATLMFGGGESARRRAFADPHVAAALAALGVERERCIAPETPLRLPMLVAPAPAFEADSGVAHADYADALAWLGDRLAGPDGGGAVDRPVHLACAEDPLAPCLRDGGVRVLDPRALPLATLVRLVREAPVVSATSAHAASDPSALAAFARPGTPVLVFQPTGGAASGDRAACLDATRLLSLLLGHQGGVLRGAPDRGAGPAMLAAIRHAATLPRRLALGARANCHPSDGGEGDPASLLDRTLSGRARLRTGAGQRPWWQVDLGGLRVVRAVGVHAPVAGEIPAPGTGEIPAPGTGDAAAPDGLRLLGSLDGVAWEVLATRDEGTPVGNGLDGRAHWFRLPPGTAAWHLRVQMTGTGVLSLDQVEVLMTDDENAGSDRR